jgi:hypothetical protein
MLALPRGGVPVGIVGTEVLKAPEWLHSADQRLFGHAAWPIDGDPALTGKGWASPKTTMTTENLAPSHELNRADPRFAIKALCLQARDRHGERTARRMASLSDRPCFSCAAPALRRETDTGLRSSGRLFCHQGQKGSAQ